jgi:hypothetical protein
MHSQVAWVNMHCNGRSGLQFCKLQCAGGFGRDSNVTGLEQLNGQNENAVIARLRRPSEKSPLSDVCILSILSRRQNEMVVSSIFSDPVRRISAVWYVHPKQFNSCLFMNRCW